MQCVGCGLLLPAYMNFCYECGAALPGKAVGPARAVTPSGETGSAPGKSVHPVEETSGAVHRGAVLPASLRLMQTFLSRGRLASLAADRPCPAEDEGACLFADISGFTPLSELLAASLEPQQGAEVLTHTVNRVFDALIAQVFRYGGDVLGFAGDAIQCWFPKEIPAWQVLACALAMQSEMAQFAEVQTPDGKRHMLMMKIGLACGPVRRMVVGSAEYGRFDLMTGTTVQRMAAAEHQAEKGEVVCASEVVEMAGTAATWSANRQGYSVLESVTRDQSPILAAGLAFDPQELQASILQPFFPPDLYNWLAVQSENFLAELRPVVSAFVRFDGLDYQSDSEAERKLDVYVRTVQRLAVQFGGSMVRLDYGDKGSVAHVLFGAPVAHEDLEARAVGWALELQNAARGLDFITDQVIGMTRGQVYAGALGAGQRRGYTLMGDEVNASARLMAACQPGQILVSQAVIKAAQKRFSFHRFSGFVVKGKFEPVPVGTPVAPLPVLQQVAPTGKLVGRGAEMAQVEAQLQALVSGTGGVLCIRGEPGAGKSRLAVELVQRAQSLGVRVLMGAGTNSFQSLPYYPWREILRSVFGLQSAWPAAQQILHMQMTVQWLNPAWQSRLPLFGDVLGLEMPDTPVTAGFDAALRQKSLFALLCDLLLMLAAQQPVLLLLEDGHWMDSSSLALIVAVAGRLSAAKLLLVASQRKLESGKPLLEGLEGLMWHHRLDLDLLAPEAVQEMVLDRLGGEAPAEILALIQERSQGNPLFVEALAEEINQVGRLQNVEGHWKLVGVEASALKLPELIQGVMLARLDRLEEVSNTILKAASVAGRSFDEALLGAIHPLHLAPDVLHLHLVDLEKRGFVLLESPEPEPRWRFKHNVLQEVAYGMLLYTQRRMLHRTVAEWYEMTRRAALSGVYHALAYHYRRAEVAEKERFYAWKAGEQAAAHYANAEALAYLARVFELLPEAAHSERFEALVLREKIYALLGKRDAQQVDLAELALFAQDLRDDHKQAYATLRQAAYAEATSDYRRAIVLLERAIWFAQKAEDVQVQSQAHLQWGRALWNLDQAEPAKGQLDRALALAQSLALPSLEGDCLVNLGILALRRGAIQEGRQYYRAAQEIYHQAGDLNGEGKALIGLGALHDQAGDHSDAQECFERALQIKREIGHREGEAILLGNLGSLASRRGDYALAGLYLEQALAMRREIRQQRGVSLTLNNIGLNFKRQGLFERGRECLEQALAIANELGLRNFQAVMLSGLGLLAHHQGENQQAVMYCQQALALACELKELSTQAEILTWQGYAYHDLGELSLAEDSYRQAIALREASGDSEPALEARSGLARARLAQGDAAAALAQAEPVLVALEEKGPLGMEEPFRVYWACIEVLQGCGDGRAAPLLQQAVGRLQEQAGCIRDPALQQAFLQNIRSHRELLAAAGIVNEMVVEELMETLINLPGHHRYLSLNHPGWRYLGLSLLLSALLVAGALTLFVAPARSAGNPTGLTEWPAWTSGDGEGGSMVWGDLDLDGDLDLVLGKRIYRSQNGQLESEPALTLPAVITQLADVDKDGYLDLEVTGGVYRSLGAALGYQTALSYTNPVPNVITRAWGDMNGDGFLDLAVGLNCQGNPACAGVQVYLNDNGVLASSPAWSGMAGSSQGYWVGWVDVDQDGLLDLQTKILAGGYAHTLSLYRNTGTSLVFFWTLYNEPYTLPEGRAWGDMNGDGYPDLAVVRNAYSPVRVYYNDGSGGISASNFWEASWKWEPPYSDENMVLGYSVAWGDADGDGDLDLAVGTSYDLQTKVYVNNGVALGDIPAWHAGSYHTVHRIAWGDADGDGDLDLVAADGGVGIIYRNDLPHFPASASWLSGGQGFATALALGDVDNDGDLDLAVGNGVNRPTELYRNTGAGFVLDTTWTQDDGSKGLAWGDMNGDGYLDLASANYAQKKVLVYANLAGSLGTTPVFSYTLATDPTSVAWGDADGDGDLDLAAGVWLAPNLLFENQAGVLQPVPAWQDVHPDRNTTQLAWGDMDNDGDLDLAVSNWAQPARIYRNTGGPLDNDVFEPEPVWTSGSTGFSSLAWGDMNGDGLLDLAASTFGRQSRVYLNHTGSLDAEPSWLSGDLDRTFMLAWGDADGDGDLDLLAANGESTWGGMAAPTRLYLNQGGMLQTTAQVAWTAAGTGGDVEIRAAAWGDLDGDGDLDMVMGGNLGLPNGNTALDNYLRVFWNGRYPSPVFHPGSQPAGVKLALNSSEAVPTFNSQSSQALAPANFFALPGIRSDGTIPILYTLFDENQDVWTVRGFYSLNGGGDWQPAEPTADTQVAGLAGSAWPGGTTYTFTWDVFGSGMFGSSDQVVFRLIAMPDPSAFPDGVPGPYERPFVSAQTYPFRVRGAQVKVLYQGQPVASALVYRVPVNRHSGTALMDSSNTPYRTDASGYLQGRGVLAVGDRLAALYPAVARPQEGYTVYYSSAAPDENGLVMTPYAGGGQQVLEVSADNPLILYDLAVSLEWDARYDPAYLTQLTHQLQRVSQLLFDWTNGQAALGKVTLSPARTAWDEADVRIYASNRLRPNATQGGVTGSVKLDAGSPNITYYPGQVNMGATWNRYGDAGVDLGDDWPRTLAHELGHYLFYLDDNYLGLVDGRVVKINTCSGVMADPYREDDPYDEFHSAEGWSTGCAASLANLSTGRWDWQTIGQFYPWLDPISQLAGPLTLPLEVTQIELAPLPDPIEALADPSFYLAPEFPEASSTARAFLFQQDYLVDLGRPVLGRVLARGAAAGDRVCLFDLDAGRMGCKVVDATNRTLQVYDTPSWQPDLLVTPVNTNTVTITLGGLPEGLAVYARLYPQHSLAGSAQALAWAGGVYTGTFELASYSGSVHAWVDEAAPRREVVSDFSLGGNPGDIIDVEGAPMLSHYGAAISKDGQVILYGDLDFPQGEFYALQAVTHLPTPPPGRKVIGQAYRLVASPNAPSLTGASLNYHYVGAQVPPGEEGWLRLYYYNPTTASWQPLDSLLDAVENTVSAPVQGEGLYAIFSALELTLQPGWNLVPYFIQETQPVTQALASVDGQYTVVYENRPQDVANPWHIYAPGAPDWVVDLHELQYSRTYWLHLGGTLTTTLYLNSGAASRPLAGASVAPPATLYGQVISLGASPVLPGLLVEALVGNTVCGSGTTQLQDGQVVYVIKVMAAADGTAACGLEGRTVIFRIGNQVMRPFVAWDNRLALRIDLAPALKTFLPSILVQP